MQLQQVNVAGTRNFGYAPATRKATGSVTVKKAASANDPRFSGIKNALKRGKRLYDISGPKGKGTFWALAAAGTAAAIFLTPLSLFGLGGLALAGCAFQAYRHFSKAGGGKDDE